MLLLAPLFPTVTHLHPYLVYLVMCVLKVEKALSLSLSPSNLPLTFLLLIFLHTPPLFLFFILHHHHDQHHPYLNSNPYHPLRKKGKQI